MTPPDSHALPWSELLTIAIVGTDRRPFNLPPTPGPLGALLAQIDTSDPAHAVLSAASLLSAYQTAGQRPATQVTTLVTPAPDDDMPTCNETARQHVFLMTHGQFQAALPEWLAALAAAHRRVPEDLIPELLALGKARPDLRPLLLPVLGARGRWLAQMHGPWAYAATALDASGWANTASNARPPLCQYLRAHDPAQARALVETTWAKEPAGTRNDLISTFATGLSLADEPFLENALNDRTQAVRRTAARLLARLPTASLSTRMATRAHAYLHITDTTPAHISVTLPPECDTEMRHDGVDPHLPNHLQLLGERAWWLMQILHTVPPSDWCTPDLPPAALLELARGHEWEKLLITSWSEAAAIHGDTPWIEALLMPKATLPATREIDQAALMRALPPDRREAVVLEHLAVHPLTLNEKHPVVTLLPVCHHAWSTLFSHSILDYLRQAVPSPFWQLRTIMTTAGLCLDPECVATITAGWPTETEGWKHWESNVNDMQAILAFRHEMLKELRRDLSSA